MTATARSIGLRLRVRMARWLKGFSRRAEHDNQGVATIRQRHIYILPTGFGYLFAAVVLVMLLGSLNYQNNLGLLFSFLLAAVGLVSMLFTWLNLLGLRVQCRGGAAIFAGDLARFQITFRDIGGRERFNLCVRTDDAENPPVDLRRDDQQTLTLALPSQHRGPFQLDEIHLETRYPIGLFRAWCYATSDAQVLVYPRPASRAPDPTPAADQQSRASGEGGDGSNDYVGPRGYRPGDSPRHLDWKALARERGLIVKQFSGEQSMRIWLDWRSVTAANDEARLSVLARQVLDAFQGRLIYGLRLPGTEVAPAEGRGHTHRCLTALARFPCASRDPV